MLVIGSVSAGLIYKQSTEISISLPCINNGSFCSDTSTCNITIVKPNSDLLIDNSPMTNQLSFHNYSLRENETTDLGIHFSTVACNDGARNGVSTFEYLITRSGKTLDTSEALVYVLLTFGIFVVFLLSLYFTIGMPYFNRKNLRGETIEITKTKYIKMGLILVTYSLFTWLLNVLIGVSDNYLNLGLFYGFVSFIFEIFVALAWPLFVLVFVWAFFEIIRDINKQKLIDKMFNLRT